MKSLFAALCLLALCPLSRGQTVAVDSYALLTYDKAAPTGMRPDAGGNWGEDANDTATQENNPWLHVRLTALVTPATATYRAPYIIPGYYIGSSTSLGSGNDWRVRLRAPDMAGIVTVEFFFEESTTALPNINVQPAPSVSTLQAATPDFTETFKATGYESLAPGMEALGYILPFWQTGETGCRYWRYSNGGIWIKGGIDSPENFLAYDEFQDYTDPTVANVAAANDPVTDEGVVPAIWLHSYADHAQDDWISGDPTWTTTGPGSSTGHGKGIIGALNALSTQGANSIYCLMMNLGGDGRDVSPFVDNPAVAGDGDVNTAPYDSEPLISGYDDSRLNYSVKRMDQWELVFRHANQKGIFINMVLAEQEHGNTNWLDDLNNGDVLSIPRKLFLKNMVAMFSHNLGVKWNLWEEWPNGQGASQVNRPELNSIAHWIQDWDAVDYDEERDKWIGHAIAVHTYPNWKRAPVTGLEWHYQHLIDSISDTNWWLDATSLQIHGGEPGSDSETVAGDYSYYVEKMAANFLFGDSNGGAPGSSSRLVLLDVDEQGAPTTGYASDDHSNPDPSATSEDRRKRVLFDVLFSGASGIEWYGGYYADGNGPVDGGGDITLEDFDTRADLLATTKAVVDFLTNTIHGVAGRDLFEFEADDSLVSNEYLHPDYDGAEVYFQDAVCYLVYYPGMGSAGPGKITVNHGGVETAATAHWYRASKMTLISSATQDLGKTTGPADYWPVPPSGATSADDYVMVVTVK